MLEAFNFKLNKKNLVILFLFSFFLRLIVFLTFIRPEERYRQPDSTDYHVYAITMALGRGMCRLDNLKPVFWRTPGYPLYLSWFYDFFGIQNARFSDSQQAQTAALLVQILLCSFIPILIFFLALFLTKTASIAWLTAWISAIHLGFVLSDTYLLTESISMVFLIPFFIYFFKSFYTSLTTMPKPVPWAKNIILAAILLAIFTWIRPMGQFVAAASAVFIIIFDRVNWKMKLKKIAVFSLVFLSLIGGWYVRNYNLTGYCFYCPMFGTYLNTFCAPKIVRAKTGKNLVDSIRHQYSLTGIQGKKDYQVATAKGKAYVGSFSHLKVAIPVLLAHPFLFIKDWLVEVARTTFELYSCQLVEFAKKTFHFDPPEEHITEKFADCLYKQKMHPIMRFIVYLELLFEILKWIGLIAGAFLFLFYPLFKRFRVPAYIKRTGLLWLKLTPMVVAFVMMTGGFGYARLRLPVEALMIILSLTFWYWVLQRKKLSRQKGHLKGKKSQNGQK